MQNSLLREAQLGKTLEGLEHSITCSDLAFSEDNSTLLSVGTYKPSVKIFNLTSMSLKVVRHCVEEPQRVVPLSKDAEKFAVMRSDRCTEFHTRNGLHETIQLLQHLRDISFSKSEAELYFCGNTSLIDKLDLEEGVFKNSIDVSETSVYSLSLSSAHDILFAAADSSCVCIDTRSGQIIKKIAFSGKAGLFKVATSDNGINFLTGYADGTVAEYDLRAANPTHIVQVEGGISSLKYSRKYKLVAAQKNFHVFSDTWDHTYANTGFPICGFSTNGCMVVVGGESEMLKSYIVDRMGDAPEWCHEIINS